MLYGCFVVGTCGLLSSSKAAQVMPLAAVAYLNCELQPAIYAGDAAIPCGRDQFAAIGCLLLSRGKSKILFLVVEPVTVSVVN